MWTDGQTGEGQAAWCDKGDHAKGVTPKNNKVQNLKVSLQAELPLFSNTLFFEGHVPLSNIQPELVSVMKRKNFCLYHVAC